MRIRPGLGVLAALCVPLAIALPSAACEPAVWKVLALASSHAGDFGTFIPLTFDEAAGPGLVLRSAAQLDAALSRPAVKDEDRRLLLRLLGRKSIDWEREMIVAIAGGPVPRGYRHGVAIVSIEFEPRRSALTVVYDVAKTEQVIVGTDGGLTAALVPRWDGEVRVVRRTSK